MNELACQHEADFKFFISQAQRSPGDFSMSRPNGASPALPNSLAIDHSSVSNPTCEQMKNLTHLPASVLNSLLDFLPQHSLLALALTNFHFYEPCMKQLYRHIVVQVEPVLRYEPKGFERERPDFIESSASTICGFQSLTRSRQDHMKLIAAKLLTLINSIKVNPSLALNIEKIDILDTFDDNVCSVLGQLFETLASVDNAIAHIYIAKESLRRKLGYHRWCSRFALQTLVIDDLSQLSELTNFPSLKRIHVAGVGNSGISPQALPLLENLDTIIVKDDPATFTRFVSAMMKLYRQSPFSLKNLKTFNVVHTHEHPANELPFIDPATIEEFQVSIGCNDARVCEMDCMLSFLADMKFERLRKLAVIQNSDPKQNNHRNNEKWDMIVFDFIKTVIDSNDTLSYLSIRHNVPADGVIDDGFEGNYLRRVKLYTIILPRLLSSIQRHIVNLLLPTFVESLACYEQPMNTFLWNGCKCSHCAVYLEKLDEYLLYHRYHNRDKQVFKDLQTTQMVRSLAQALADRVGYDQTTGDLFQLTKSMRNTTWNFHDNTSSVPFRCLPVKTYDIDEMEDDKDDGYDAKEKFFDARSTPNDCAFLKEQFFPNYTIVIAHFLNDLIRKMINLNRGDAEDADIGRVSYENDGFTNLQINKMMINGLDYNFDHELNGTIFFTNSYDATEND